MAFSSPQTSQRKLAVQPFTILSTLSRTHVQKSHFSKASTRENKNKAHSRPLAADTNSWVYAKLISEIEIGLLCELWYYIMQYSAVLFNKNYSYSWQEKSFIIKLCNFHAFQLSGMPVLLKAPFKT